MPQARDEAGNIWEVDANGNPVRLISRAGASSAPRVTQLPQSPSEQAAAARAQAGDARDQTRTDITVRGEKRDITNTAFDQATKLRNEFQKLPQVTEYQTVIRQYATALKTKPTPQGDQALITAYAKMLDPGSVVREQEFNTVAAGDSSLGKATALLGKELGLDGNGLLRPEVRARVRSEMLNLAQNYNTAYNQARQEYTDRSSRMGFDAREVVGTHFGRPYYKDIEKALGGSGDGRSQVGPGVNVSGGNATPASLAAADASTKSIPVPPQMQREFEGYVRQRLGNLNPQEYAAFRTSLDAKYNFPGKQDAVYLEEAKLLNTAAQNPNRYNINLSIPPANAAMTGADRFKAGLLNNEAGALLLGATSLGGGMDELAGAVRTATMGGDYAVNRDVINGYRQAAADAYPKSTFAGNIGGALATGYGVGRFAPSLVAPIAQIANTGRGAGLLGAAYGATTGALENNDNRLRGAVTGGVSGAVGGVAGNKVVAPFSDMIARSQVGQQFGRGADFVSRQFGRQGGYTPPPTLSATEAAIRDNASDLSNVQRMLAEAREMKLPIALADTDPKLRMFTGAVTRKSPDARSFAETILEPRSAGQSERALTGIDQYLAPRVDIERRGKQLLDAGRNASAPLYQMARSQAAPVDPEVAALLQTPAGREALARAQTMAANEGRNPNAIGFDLNDQGEVVLKSAPSFETLDYVKRGFDSRLNDARNPVTGLLDLQGDPMLQSVEGLRQRFVSRLDALNPNYPKARAEYAKFAQAKDALERGRDLQAIQVLPRQANAALSGIKPENMSELQRGYATALGDTIEKVSLNGNPYEAIYRSPAQREKLAMVFPSGAEKFGKQYGLEREMAKTAREVLGGSPTAARLQADDAFGPSFGENAANAALDYAATGGAGNVITLGRMALQKVRDANAVGVGKRAEERAAQLAPALLDPNNAAAAEEYINGLLIKALKLDERAAKYRKSGGLLGAATGSAASSFFPM